MFLIFGKKSELSAHWGADLTTSDADSIPFVNIIQYTSELICRKKSDQHELMCSMALTQFNQLIPTS